MSITKTEISDEEGPSPKEVVKAETIPKLDILVRVILAMRESTIIPGEKNIKESKKKKEKGKKKKKK